MPNKSAPISIRLAPEHFQALKELANTHNAGISQVTQTCIIYALNQLSQDLQQHETNSGNNQLEISF